MIDDLGKDRFHLHVYPSQGYYFQIKFEKDTDFENFTGVGIVYDKKRSIHY